MKPTVRCTTLGALGFGVVAMAMLSLTGCSDKAKQRGGAPAATGKSAAKSGTSETITLATTTSTADTGLLDVLLPRFKEASGVEVKAVSVGSGQALELGRKGDADVLLTHSPAAEEKFMAEGFGESRRPLMYNDFVLVGHAADPAKIKEAKSIGDALSRIAQAKATFISRGDESGTQVKEKQLWEAAKTKPDGDWYVQAATGMGAVLRMANEKKAYTLSDLATYLSQKGTIQLDVLYQGDAALKNHYSVIVVNPQKNPNVHREAAEKFAQFLLSEEGGKILSQFGADKFGQPLFFLENPAAGK